MSASVGTARKGFTQSPRPLVPICLAAMLGILTAEWLGPPALVALIVSGSCWALTWRRQRPWRRRALTLASVAALAAGWNQQSQEPRSNVDSAGLGDRDLAIAAIRGRVASLPRRYSADLGPNEIVMSRYRGDPMTTRFDLQMTETRARGGWEAAGGRIAVYVRGDASAVQFGQRVELVGHLGKPAAPNNPGEFDFRQYLARQGIDATLRLESPAAIVAMDEPAAARWLPVLQLRAASILSAAMPPREAALAEALVLGTRTRLSRTQLVPYLEGGTIHLLVVSGLQVGIVAGLLWGISRLIPLRPAARGILVTLAVIGYAIFAGADPPVIRAAVVIALWLAGWGLGRQSDPINSLAGAALVLMAWNPADLFRAGPQLSFACVLSLILFGPTKTPAIEPDAPVLFEPAAVRILRPILALLARLTRESVVVWLVTAPLVAFHFHLWAPVSVLASVLLIPATTVALVLVLIVFAVGATFPSLVGVPAALCSAVLDGVDRSMIALAKMPAAFFYTAGPPAWWTAILYSLLFIPGCLGLGRAPGRAIRAALVAWLALGALVPWFNHFPSAPEFHQLAVGHGSAGILRLPRHTILYDCGSLWRGNVTDRTVAPFLWSQRIGAIDAILLSHADVDHFSGVAELARRFPIRAVFVTPQFLHSDQAEVRQLLRELAERAVPIHTLRQGDRLRAGEATLWILSPTGEAVFPDDNAASLVALVTASGKKLLWTGDLAEPALGALLARPLSRVDVLVAPHHGRAANNPGRLAEWADPALVLSTQGRLRALPDPLDVYSRRGARVYRTDQEGAISVRFETELLVETFRTSRREKFPALSIAP